MSENDVISELHANIVRSFLSFETSNGKRYDIFGISLKKGAKIHIHLMKKMQQ